MTTATAGREVTYLEAISQALDEEMTRDERVFLMGELTAKYPFYYTADLDMPQWEPKACPLCGAKKPLLFWRDLPEF